MTKNHVFMTSPVWIHDNGTCAEVDLGGLGRGMVEEDRGRCRLLVAPDEALHGVVTSREAVTFKKSLMDGRRLNAPLHPGADEFSHRSCQGLRRLVGPRRLDESLQVLVGWQGATWVKPALVDGDRS